MQEPQRYIEQDDSLQESRDQKLRVKNGGRIEGTEGGLRVDVFDHDANSEYDFSEHDCLVCELPENAQEYIISDIEYEESNA
tara:strand:+ start:1177 stop:1422 length:246 start_codon:yes stop_codon:yes gene_type:complete